MLTRAIHRVGLYVLLALPGIASAQPPDPGEGEPSELATSAARDLFLRGVAASRDGRWDEAEDCFRRAHDLIPAPSTLLNLASARDHLGQPVQATEDYRQFLREASPELLEQWEARVREALTRLDTQIVRLEVQVAGIAAADVVLVDGEVLPQAALGAPVPLDPGGHEVVVRRGDEEVARRSLTLSAGARESVQLVLAPTVDPSGPPTESEPAWPWVVGISVGAAVVVGAIVLAVVLASEPGISGNFEPGTTVVH